ncbi:cytochrome P450 [Mycena olivaceomarginata]|nr:cytochrome P450 [Mycena olivaceomarginata]
MIRKLQSAIQSRVQDGPKEVCRTYRLTLPRMNELRPQIDIMLWMTRTALVLIGQAGLGHSFDSLDTDEIPLERHPHPILLVTVHKMALGMKYILPWVTKLGTPNFRRLIVNIFPWQTLHEGRDTADTLYATAVRIYHLKKTALVDEGSSSPIAGQGKDIASILSTLSALPDAQEKLRREIQSAQQSPVDISYDQLNSMEYLDAICRETLRLCSPGSQPCTRTQKDVALTTSTPITTLDGSTATEIPIPARTEVIVSILASNRNPDIWGSDALKWKPERWLSPLSKSVTEANLPGIYSHLMTFAAGGRSYPLFCSGFKFSQLEMSKLTSDQLVPPLISRLSLLLGR